MSVFFSSFSNPFVLFWGSHLLVISLLLVLFSWIWLSKSPNVINFQRLLVGVGLFTHMVIFHSYYLAINQYNIAGFLPFHLCSLSAILVAVALLTQNKKLSTIAIYWAPVAALLAIILPDIGSDQNLLSFRFLEFFTSHILILVGSFWLLFNQEIKLTLRTCLMSYGILVSTLPLIYLINRLTKGNYMYMINKPSGGQMNFLPTEPYHFLGLMILVLLVFLGELVVFGWVRKSKGKNANSLNFHQNITKDLHYS